MTMTDVMNAVLDAIRPLLQPMGMIGAVVGGIMFLFGVAKTVFETRDERRFRVLSALENLAPGAVMLAVSLLGIWLSGSEFGTSGVGFIVTVLVYIVLFNRLWDLPKKLFETLSDDSGYRRSFEPPVPRLAGSDENALTARADPSSTSTPDKASPTGRSVRAGEQAARDYDALMLRYAAYETDPWLAVSYPGMHSFPVAEAAAFLTDLRRVRRAQAAWELDRDEKAGEAFLSAVDAATVTFDTAEKAVRRLGMQVMSSTEQTRLQDAKTILTLLESEAMGDEARNAQYRRLLRLTDGLVDMTTPELTRALAPAVPMLTLPTTPAPAA